MAMMSTVQVSLMWRVAVHSARRLRITSHSHNHGIQGVDPGMRGRLGAGARRGIITKEPMLRPFQAAPNVIEDDNRSYQDNKRIWTMKTEDRTYKHI